MHRVTLAALVVLLCPACDGGSKPKPAAREAAAAKPETKAPESKVAEPATAEPATAEPATAEPAASEPVTAEAVAAADPLGQRFRDPPWFNNNMFGDKGNRVDFARSEANEAGLFKSHIIFELADGTTVEDCATTVTEKLKDAVQLGRKDQPSADRIQLEGSAERYDVTVVCGEGKGKMRAYVSYEWTR